jgi:hypothetical protein
MDSLGGSIWLARERAARERVSRGSGGSLCKRGKQFHGGGFFWLAFVLAEPVSHLRIFYVFDLTRPNGAGLRPILL